MSDPAVEAAQRVGFRDFPPKARGLAIDAAREAIQPIRQIHRAVATRTALAVWSARGAGIR